jgi:protocatechuate 3,4-dioxygenase beta subunit
MPIKSFIGRNRQFLQSLVFGALAFTAAGAFAEDVVLTPRQTEGPFYPDKLPPDTDNDLTVLKDSSPPAKGEVVNLSGRVLDQTGKPVQGAVIEIWQADNNGVYIHTRSPDQDRRDRNFQGFGRCLTGSSGEYSFRTIKPVSYTFGIQRAPHIHFIIKQGDKRMLTSQLYIKGHPLNEQDIVLQGIQNRAAREAVIIDFKPRKDSKTGELEAVLNIVIGKNPEDSSEDRLRHRDGFPIDVGPNPRF